jgi:hypothetical protein
MAFESKRLRVQLPCEEGTSLIDEAFQVVHPTFCPYPSVEIFVPAGPIAQCALVSVVCGAGTREGLGDKDSLLVTPETLTILRRQIETRLAMVKDAQQAIAGLQAAADEGEQ